MTWPPLCRLHQAMLSHDRATIILADLSLLLIAIPSARRIAGTITSVRLLPVSSAVRLLAVSTAAVRPACRCAVLTAVLPTTVGRSAACCAVGGLLTVARRPEPGPAQQQLTLYPLRAAQHQVQVRACPQLDSRRGDLDALLTAGTRSWSALWLTQLQRDGLLWG